MKSAVKRKDFSDVKMEKPHVELALFLTILFLFILLLLRNVGLYTYLGDESIYSKFSRLLPFEKATIPDYLYYFIYQATSACGDGFLECSRLLNALFFFSSSPFIYLASRKYCSQKTASVVLALTLLGPINSYTARYMPESMYFFFFWVFAWYFLKAGAIDKKTCIVSGGILGATSLVKPHAVFLLLAVIAFISYLQSNANERRIANGLHYTLLTATSFFVAKFAFSYYFAGNNGLTLFGSFYNELGAKSDLTLAHFLGLSSIAFHNISGHILAICLMYGMPFALCVYSLFRAEEFKKIDFVAPFTLFVVVGLVLIVGYFTASVITASQYESPDRLHMRYYNFALPLFFIVAASQLNSESIDASRKWRALAALPIGIATLWAMHTHMAPFALNFVDNPELRGVTFSHKTLYFLGAISLLSLSLWVYSSKIGSRSFVYVFMPLSLALSSVYVSQEMRLSLTPGIGQKAGMLVKQYLSREESSRLVIVGAVPSDLYTALFYIDNPDAAMMEVREDIDLSTIPADKEWVLVIGGNPLPKEAKPYVTTSGFRLMRIRDH